MTILVLIIYFFYSSWLQDSYALERMKMVEKQIKARGVVSESVLNAMRTVPRHEFVPPDRAKYAYNDYPLAIGYGQTISQPYIVAYMTEALNLEKEDVILEVGTGSGYQAAVLAELVKEVHTIEIIRPLGERAKVTLSALGYKNVHVYIGDGYNGIKSKAPFDAIMVTAGAEKVPPPLIEQLNEGGRMIIPVGTVNDVQYLLLIKKNKGKITRKTLLPVRFVPFTREKE
ncbi:MAG: protein-L-isoaspartate(D-aspartate) O-methyltransferase [Bacteroidales bacterium]|nr:protein-L-isoaspartate(D-aspartate) O-methyltransferase [Bacteroidales bacterium]